MQSVIFRGCLELLSTLPPNTREVVLESFTYIYLEEDDLRNGLVETLNSIPSLGSVTLLLTDIGPGLDNITFDHVRDDIRSSLANLRPNLVIITR